jgi:hypothetical protein
MSAQEHGGLQMRGAQRGNTVANEQIRKRIAETGIRKTARKADTDSKTVMTIVRGTGQAY